MTDNEKWEAVLRNDERYDGLFFYGVKSTKVFCQPSCKSKVPLKKNVVYFENLKQAEQAGHRPCKRCRPDLLQYRPVKETADKIKLLLDNHFSQQKILNQKLGQLGVTYRRAIHIFREYYGVTPKTYYDNLRLDETRKRLLNTNDTIIDIAYSVGFQSLSAFYSFFHKNMNSSPSKYRKENKHGIRA
jgi:AraC family transcriptional regulator of adaptative response / methylphosphotriester-DNA alkyltransferase methyltransferase